MFDFLKSGKNRKNAGSGAGKTPKRGSVVSDSRGTISFGKFTFNVMEYNAKGFIIEPYDKDLLIKGQNFKFDIDVANGDHFFKGRGEALVTKVTGNTLAAVFTSKLVNSDA
jgi:hypothetical protein